MKEPMTGKLYHAAGSRFIWKEIFNPQESNLTLLSGSEIQLQNCCGPEAAFRKEETLLFNLAESVTCEVEGKPYALAHYDVLYIPMDTPFRLEHRGTGAGLLYLYRARGSDRHPVHHSPWKRYRRLKDRTRRLRRKRVYLMFDVSEKADKLMAGYTFYEPFTRAWPPHNHTDQEEVYSFIEGRGAMSVYEDDEHQSFVTSVRKGDHITIPLLQYHPVFSQEEPLAFIWCIAGRRYWVGDENPDFMSGKGKKITT